MTFALTALFWFIVVSGLIAWAVSGFALCVVLCKVIRNADKQIPRDRR